MAYVRNSDLTFEHIKHIASKCEYKVISPASREMVLAVETPVGEIIEFRNLGAARRFLSADLKDIRAERAAC